MEKTHIYIVDDEAHIRELINYNLEENGYRTTCFETAVEMLNKIEDNLPDLILLDLMLPGIDGIEACRCIRQNTKTRKVPIIMLTAKNEEFDKVLGLEIGADDYMTKPFSVRELFARIRAVLRRINEETPSEEQNGDEKIVIDDLVIDSLRHEVRRGGNLLDLTLKEFELLKILAINAPNVLSRDTLLNKIWGYDYFGESRTVDVHIKNLRKIIGDSQERYIETVRGVGYKLKK